jgi:hypothetical protein
MPVETVKLNLHIRRKKNKVVFDNLARLGNLVLTAKSHQDLLDGLHPWHAPLSLKFNNTLPYALGLVGIFWCLLLFISPSHIYLQMMFLAGLCMVFWAWISCEKSSTVELMVAELESKAIQFKYDLHFSSPPLHLGIHLQPAFLQSKLKQLFPLFNLGTIANDFPRYASCQWSDEQGKQHSVLIFEYRYVTEMTIRDKNGKDVSIKEIEKKLWGAFVFDIQSLNGIAATTSRRHFPKPYQIKWQSSDILTNQKLNIYGTDTLSLAKQLKPTQILKLNDFFNQREGNLMFHPHDNIMCYLGSQNLFHATGAKNKKIQDISTLRGHLRTLKLLHLEQLQKDLTRFLQ